MKKLLGSLTLFCTLNLMGAANSTIFNLSHITAVPAGYYMPWENPGVQDFSISWQDFTNQLLFQIANQYYVSNADWAVSNNLWIMFSSGGASTNSISLTKTNGVAVTAVSNTNLDFVDGTNIHFTGTAVGGTVRISGSVTGTVASASTATTASIATNGPDGNGLATTNFVINQIGGIGRFMFLTSTTNTGALAGRTNNFQGWTSASSVTVTQDISVFNTGDYIRQTVSTQAISQVLQGPISVTSFAYRTGGGGTIQVHYEIYVYDTVSNVLYELGQSVPLTITTGPPTEYDYSISTTQSFFATNSSRLVAALKVDNAGTGADVIHLVNGGIYDAHVNFIQALSGITIDGSQVNGIVPAATNVFPATNSLTISGTNVTVDLSLGNAFSLTLNGTNAYVRATNTAPMRWARLEIIQGSGLTNTVLFNTNYTQPTIYGQVITMPTNTAFSRQWVDIQGDSSGNTNTLWQTIKP
jgi:hypothetical protein